tara:strand:- start:24 stop:293 length:270 start_codon:yes stop_codon:yes gene_type:complete
MKKYLFYSGGIVIHHTVLKNLFSARLSDCGMRNILKYWHTRTIQNQIIHDIHLLQDGKNIDYRYIDPNPKVSADEQFDALELKNKNKNK